jgi:hypothetical protein
VELFLDVIIELDSWRFNVELAGSGEISVVGNLQLTVLIKDLDISFCSNGNLQLAGCLDGSGETKNCDL